MPGAGPQAWDRYAYVNDNPLRYTDPSGHAIECGVMPDDGCGSYTPSGEGVVHDDSLGGNVEEQKGNLSEETGPITDFILQWPGSSDFYSEAATVLDLLAWLTDIYAAGTVTYGGIIGAGIPAAFLPMGIPEVPVATGLAGMAIAELYVQPLLTVGNSLATLSTISTVIADTKSGNTRIEEGVFSNTVVNSATLTGWVNKEAYISLILQTIAIGNDRGGVSFSVGDLHWDTVPFPDGH